MIIGLSPEYLQDTVPHINKFISQDTLKSGIDTLYVIIQTGNQEADTAGRDSATITVRTHSREPGTLSSSLRVSNTESKFIDTTSVCSRNPVADVTFFDPDYIICSVDPELLLRFPYQFTDKNIKIQAERKALLEKHLRNGELLHQSLFHDDWVTGILLVAIVLFSLVQATSKNFFHGIARFFLFRGINEEGTRDMLGMFQWQSTLLNLSSFMIISVFACFAASYYSLIPDSISGFSGWFIALGSVIASVTLRHLTCYLTGILSDQRSIFHDYLHTVYQSYRFGAFFLFILVILMAYTHFQADTGYLISGAGILIILYLFRILRLFLIFINRNISIFYLILYLCALEILPVLITIKYFSGLA